MEVEMNVVRVEKGDHEKVEPGFYMVDEIVTKIEGGKKKNIAKMGHVISPVNNKMLEHQIEQTPNKLDITSPEVELVGYKNANKKLVKDNEELKRLNKELSERLGKENVSYKTTAQNGISKINDIFSAEGKFSIEDAEEILTLSKALKTLRDVMASFE